MPLSLFLSLSQYFSLSLSLSLFLSLSLYLSSSLSLFLSLYLSLFSYLFLMYKNASRSFYERVGLNRYSYFYLPRSNHETCLPTLWMQCIKQTLDNIALSRVRGVQVYSVRVGPWPTSYHLQWGRGDKSPFWTSPPPQQPWLEQL